MASAFPKVQFVQEPAAVPIVLFDVNTTDGIYVTENNFATFTLGAPDGEFEPETVNGDDGYRTAEFTVCVMESYTNTAALFSSLSKQIQRLAGWLMVQFSSTSKPMFLRYYKTPYEATDWERAENQTFTLPVMLRCDPSVYGEKVTLSTVEIVNNPASGAGNRATYVLPTVKGDMPTPLIVKIIPDQDWTGYEPFMASVSYRAGQTWTGPILWDLTAAQWTAGTGTGADTVDAAFVGGSYRLVSATMTSMVTRLTSDTDLSPVPPAGDYLVMMRVGTSDDLSTFAVRLGQKFNLTQVRWGDTKTITRPNLSGAGSTSYRCWVPMGSFTFPYGAQNIDLDDVGGVTVPALEIQAQRLSGTANLHLDAILLIPIATAATAEDSRSQRSRFHGFGLEAPASSRSGVWDGHKRRFAAYDLDLNLAQIRQPDIRGGWLRVVPGATNILHLLQQSMVDTPFFTDVADTDVIANTADVTLSYYPRYLHFRPDTE